MHVHCYIVAYLTLIQCASGQIQTCEVSTKNGVIRGSKEQTIRGNKSYCAYTRVPYALPPLGPLRFKAPQPAQPWTGVLNATESIGACAQLNLLTREFIGNEDCLFLNVYVPQVVNNSSNPIPVLVWIHGGGFEYGEGGPFLAGPQNFIDEDIIIVTFNYRLGPFGFLSLATKEYPGNMGLKDQRLCMRWVKENIRVFGGDPAQVTIGGESAGAVSGTMHLLSSVNNEGLFQRLIAQSGTALNLWAMVPVNEARMRAFLLGRALGTWVQNDKVLLKKLHESSDEEIIAAAEKVTVFGMAFIPTVEPEGTPGSILTECPLDILRYAKFPSISLLTGFNSDEGILPYSVLNGLLYYVQRIENTALIGGLRFSRIWGPLFSRMRKFVESSVIQVTTDRMFIRGIQMTANLIARRAPVYLYSFNFVGEGNIHDRLYKTKVNGSAHADELPYLFKTEWVGEHMKDSREEIVSKRISKMWANFIKFGDPTPDKDAFLTPWPRYTPNQRKYLEIDDILTVKTYPTTWATRSSESFLKAQPRGQCKLSMQP